MFDKHIFLVYLFTLGTYFWPFMACICIAQPHSFPLTTKSTTTMSSAQCPIDQEWSQYLISICPQVPYSWWPGYSGSDLYAGAVREIDFSDERGRYFYLRMMMMLGVVIQCDTMPSCTTPTRSNMGMLASASHLTRLPIRRMKQSVWFIAMLPNIPSNHSI